MHFFVGLGFQEYFGCLPGALLGDLAWNAGCLSPAKTDGLRTRPRFQDLAFLGRGQRDRQSSKPLSRVGDAAVDYAILATGFRLKDTEFPSCGAGGFESSESLNTGVRVIVLFGFSCEGVVEPVREILTDRCFVLQVVEDGGVDLF